MMNIRPLNKSDLKSLKAFTDKTIGHNYYSIEELENIYQCSIKNEKMCTFVLEVDGQIKGVRITIPPGQWHSGKGGVGLNPQKWPYDLKDTAYFQSLFIDPSYTGKGLGKKLSLESIKVLKELGAKGIVCHSWKESPNNSSQRYLKSLNFIYIAEHPNYWSQVNYLCSGCKVKPCTCTAEEMYLDIMSASHL